MDSFTAGRTLLEYRSAMTNSEIEQAEAPVLSPAEAADRLGIRAAMLRRYAASYEKTFGPLPRDERGSRRYPVEAISRFVMVRDLYRTSVVSSILEGFEHLKKPEIERTAGTVDLPVTSTEQLVKRVLTEIEASSQKQHALLVDLERETRILREQVEQLRSDLDEANEKRGFFARLFGRGTSNR